MSRQPTKFFRVPVTVDVRTFVQLQRKAKERDVHVVKYSSDCVVSSVSEQRKPAPLKRQA